MSMYQKESLISVILPVYNGEKFVAKAISSVLNQSYTKFQLIIVNDGSSDSSLNVINSYKDSRIVVIDKSNGGPGSARNVGIKNSSGDFIALIDQDDTWEREKLELQMPLFFTNSNILLVYSDALSLSMDIPSDSILWSKLHKFKRGAVIPDLFKANFILASSVIFKKNVVQSVGFFNESKKMFGCDDYDYWLKISAIGQVDFVLKPLVNRYRTNMNFSLYNAKSISMMYENTIYVNKQFLNNNNKIVVKENRLKKMISDKYIRQLDGLMFNRLYFHAIRNIFWSLILNPKNYSKVIMIGSFIINKLILRRNVKFPSLN